MTRLSAEVFRGDFLIVGRGGSCFFEWRKGAQVEVPEDNLNALALNREGRVLDDAEMTAFLDAERPM